MQVYIILVGLLVHDESLVWWIFSTLHSTKKPVTTMLTYPWKCTVLHCNHLGITWKPLVLMTWHFDYCPSASEGDNQSVRSSAPVVSRWFPRGYNVKLYISSEGDNQSVRSSAPVVSRWFPGGYNVKLYISRGRLAWWLLAFLHSVRKQTSFMATSMHHFTTRSQFTRQPDFSRCQNDVTLSSHTWYDNGGEKWRRGIGLLYCLRAERKKSCMDNISALSVKPLTFTFTCL